MKNFIKGLLTNRFGIVLAALNVCYFLSRSYVHRTFEHIHGENCIFSNGRHFFDIFYGLNLNSSELLIILNLPAEIFSLLAGIVIRENLPHLCVFTQGKFQLVFFIFSVTFQWLFIGWLAKTVAGKIQSMKS